MTQVRHFVDPETVRTKLENAAARFLFDQREPKRVPVKRDRLLIGVRGTFDRDIGAAGKLRSVEFGHHIVDLRLRSHAVKDARVIFARRSWLFPTRLRRPRNRRDRWSEKRSLSRCRASEFWKRIRFRRRRSTSGRRRRDRKLFPSPRSSLLTAEVLFGDRSRWAPAA